MKSLIYFALAMILTFILKALGFVMIAKTIAFVAIALFIIKFIFWLVIFGLFFIGLITDTKDENKED